MAEQNDASRRQAPSGPHEGGKRPEPPRDANGNPLPPPDGKRGRPPHAGKGGNGTVEA